MVTTEYIESLELEDSSLHSYFGYIYESRVNGQSSQVRELIGKLDSEQKKEFIDYVNSEVSEEYRDDLLKELV